jgi:hypothetical protein
MFLITEIAPTVVFIIVAKKREGMDNTITPRMSEGGNCL